VRAAAARRVDSGLVERATRRIGASRELALDPDVRALLGALGEDADTGAGAAADAIIRKAVDQLAPGTVIADFFLPYLCCGGTAVQYVLPQPPLGLAVSLGCTNADGFAAATLVPQGGIAPFAWRSDEQAYQPLSGPVSLPQGVHMLAIRDSAGAESAAQPVSVPPVLRLGQESYVDDAGSMTWRVAFEVLGGVPPWSADSGGFDGNLYVSDPVPGGEALRVVVTDAAGCRASGEFRHELPGCDLPCDGFALRCGYRFWLPDPDRLRPYGANGVSAKAVSFRFAGPDGATIDLTEKLQQALNAPGDALNRDYDNVAAAWVKRINAAIEDATRSTDWLVFAYERGADGMPVLFIERFECLDFDFHVQAAYVRRERAERRDVVYGPKGTRFIDEDGSEVTFPSFNCRRIAKCDPARPVTEFCKEVGIKLEISGGLSRMNLVLEASVSGPEPAVVLVWEAPECRPAFVIGPHATFAIVDNQPTVKTVRLSGFSRQGCMVLATRSFNVG
jgi:hypothetical protein